MELLQQTYTPASILPAPEQKQEWTIEEFASEKNITPRAVRKLIQANRIGEQYEVVNISERKRVIRYKGLTAVQPVAREFSQKQLQIAACREQIIEIFGGYLAMQKRDNFLLDYDLKNWPEIYAVLGPLSERTLYRWAEIYNEDGFNGLIPRYEREQGRTVSEQEKQCLLKYYLLPNGLSKAQVIKSARRDNPELINKSDKTYERFLEEWKQDNYDLYAYSQSSKYFNDKVVPDIQRDYNKIEVGDIWVADGHTLNFEVINPATGKPKRMTLVLIIDMKSWMPMGWEIMPSENIYSVMNALRRGIEKVGYTPKVFYVDNGRAFRSKQFTGITGVLNQLNIKVMHARPYHGQSKTIERLFGQMLELEKLTLTYTGSSIDTKPARMMRNEVMHRSIYERVLARDFNGGITIADTHYMIENWVHVYANTPHKSGRQKGLTPLEVYKASISKVDYYPRRVDPVQLRMLMNYGEVKTLYKNGIRFNGEFYWADEFFSMERGAGHHKLFIRYDYVDDSQIYVYRNDKFLCVATKTGYQHPAANMLGDRTDINSLMLATRKQKELAETGKKRAAAALTQIMLGPSTTEVEKTELAIKKRHNKKKGVNNEEDTNKKRNEILEDDTFLFDQTFSNFADLVNQQLLERK